MKKVIMFNLSIFLLITTFACSYEPVNMNKWCDNYMRDFNDKWDRVDQRMQAQESNRIQRDILREMQKQNRSGIYRYGR